MGRHYVTVKAPDGLPVRVREGAFPAPGQPGLADQVASLRYPVPQVGEGRGNVGGDSEFRARDRGQR